MATLLSSLLLSFARRYAAVDASAVRIGIDGGRLEVRDVALDVAAVSALIPLPFTVVAARAGCLRLHVPWQAITSAAAVAVRLEGLSITAAPKAGGGDGAGAGQDSGGVASPHVTANGERGGEDATEEHRAAAAAAEGTAPASGTPATAEAAAAERRRRKRAKYGRNWRERRRSGRPAAGGSSARGGGGGGGGGATGVDGHGNGEHPGVADGAAAAAVTAGGGGPGEAGWSTKVLAFLGLNASVTVTDLRLHYGDGRCVARLIVARLSARSTDPAWAAASLPADALTARPGVLRKRLVLAGVTLQLAPAPSAGVGDGDTGGTAGGGDTGRRAAAAGGVFPPTPHWGRTSTVLRDAGVTARVLVVAGNGVLLRPRGGGAPHTPRNGDGRGGGEVADASDSVSADGGGFGGEHPHAAAVTPRPPPPSRPTPSVFGDAKHVEVGLELANAAVAISARQLEWMRAILEDVVGAGAAEGDDSSSGAESSLSDVDAATASRARRGVQRLAVEVLREGEDTLVAGAGGARSPRLDDDGDGVPVVDGLDGPTAPPMAMRAAADVAPAAGGELLAPNSTADASVASMWAASGDDVGGGSTELGATTAPPAAAAAAVLSGSILLPAADTYAPHDQAPTSGTPLPDTSPLSAAHDRVSSASTKAEAAAAGGGFRAFWRSITEETAIDSTATANSEDAAVLLGLRPPYGSSPAVLSDSDSADAYGADGLGGGSEDGDEARGRSSASSGESDSGTLVIVADGDSSDEGGVGVERNGTGGSVGLLDVLSVQGGPVAVGAGTTAVPGAAVTAPAAPTGGHGGGGDGHGGRGVHRRARSASSVRGGASDGGGDSEREVGGGGGDGGDGGGDVAAEAWPRPRSRGSLLRAVRRAAAAGGLTLRVRVAMRSPPLTGGGTTMTAAAASAAAATAAPAATVASDATSAAAAASAGGLPDAGGRGGRGVVNGATTAGLPPLGAVAPPSDFPGDSVAAVDNDNDPAAPSEADVAALRAELVAAATRNARLADDMAALEVAAGTASRSKDAMVRQLEAALATAERNLQTLLGREEARCRREAAAAVVAPPPPPEGDDVGGGGGGSGSWGGRRRSDGGAGGARPGRRAGRQPDGDRVSDGLLVV